MEETRKTRLIFVQNLNFETKDEDIKTHFSKVGEIENITRFEKREGKSGACIVAFKDPKSAEKALELHESYLDNRYLEVSFYERKKRIIDRDNREAPRVGKLEERKEKRHHKRKRHHQSSDSSSSEESEKEEKPKKHHKKSSRHSRHRKHSSTDESSN